MSIDANKVDLNDPEVQAAIQEVIDRKKDAFADYSSFPIRYVLESQRGICVGETVEIRSPFDTAFGVVMAKLADGIWRCRVMDIEVVAHEVGLTWVTNTGEYDGVKRTR